MNWNGYGRKRSLLKVEGTTWHLPGETEVNHE
jgi:hypothetical protein